MSYYTTWEARKAPPHSCIDRFVTDWRVSFNLKMLEQNIHIFKWQQAIRFVTIHNTQDARIHTNF